MPSLQPLRNLDLASTLQVSQYASRASTANDNNNNNNDRNSTLPWIIVAAVAALLALGSCIALVLISFSKRRILKRQLEEARLRDPCLGPKEFSRRRRLTAEDQMHEAEEQREAMIRKSLASRSMRSPSMSTIGSHMTDDRASSMTEQPAASFLQPSNHSLGIEKEIEMRLSRPASAASLRMQRTRSISPFPDLPQPAMSRSASLSRFPLHELRVDPPPLLEQHPCLRGEGKATTNRRISSVQ